MTAKLDYVWKLREVMATRGMFQTTDLRPKLAGRTGSWSATGLASTAPVRRRSSAVTFSP